MLRQRVITAIGLLIFFATILASRSALVFGVALIVVVVAAAWEWERLGGHPSPMPIWMGLGVALPVVFYFFFKSQPVVIPVQIIYGVCGACALIWITIVPAVLRTHFRLLEWPIVFGVVGAIILMGTWIGAVSLYGHGISVLLSCGCVPIVADTAAYFVGRKFGKHKLAPTISPGKTVEGAIGGVIAVAVVLGAWVIISGWAPWWIFIFIMLAGLSIVGDLFESLLKRQAGVKDSSQLLPGHGGVLDRIDAQLPVLPMAALAFSVFPL
jgi:phosphatidate cytidylyltransferase